MDKLENILESLLFLSGTPMLISDIAEKLELAEDDILASADILRQKYGQECGIQLLKFNKKLQFSSNPIYAEEVSKVLNPIKEKELSNATLETVAIIAYKQPITRLEIEEIRGVSSDYALQMLSKNNLIEVVGRKDAIGKPVLFGTTDSFLKRFKLKTLEELPDMESLIERIKVIAGASSELYHRDEYAKNQIDMNEVLDPTELPDFLKDEKDIQII